MYVYILDINGNPLMPTKRYGKVRRLLKQNLAKVVNKCPFTIQLLYETTDFIQPINLGVDAGSKVIGISVTTEKNVLFEAEVELRNDIVELLATRRQARRARRNRKTRYRPARWNNRANAKQDGRLMPSVKHKIQTHITIIEKLYEILPISNLFVEVASFDIQKIKNPNIEGKEYQEGEQLDCWNVREYILFRDDHKCQCCKGKSKDPVLNVHHIESRKTGGNAPNNLITLCETCHNDYHDGKIKLPSYIKRGMKFNDTTFMNIMRWNLYEQLKELFPNVQLTYGYITKNTRIANKLPKEHYIDARCISKNPTAIPLNFIYKYKKIRQHNRQLHKFVPNKKGIRQNNQAPFEVRGFRLFDVVSYNNQICYISGRRQSGYFTLKTIDIIDNNSIKTLINISYKKLKLVRHSSAFLILQQQIA